MSDWHVLLMVVAAYTVGSIPCGYLIARARGVDIRQHGSKNIGATNVGRVLGRKAGFLCFALDLLKGLLPVLAAGAALGALGNPAPEQAVTWRWLLIGAATMLGHVFPVWLRFKGGKGVATGLGMLLGFHPFVTLAAILAFATWLVVLRLWRYVSLASCAAALSIPAWVLLAYRLPAPLGAGGGPAAEILTAPATSPAGSAWSALGPYLATTLALAALVIARHRTNLRRLANGTEPKVTWLAGKTP